MQLLKDKSAIVTGATAGIGREIALLFARHGANVAIIGTNEERAAKVLAELEALRSSPEQKFTKVLVNVADKKAVDQVIEQLLTHFGKIDILVNNAGITRDGLLMKMSEEDWDAVIRYQSQICLQLLPSARPSHAQSKGRKDHQYLFCGRLDGQCRASQLCCFEVRDDRLHQSPRARSRLQKHLRELHRSRYYPNSDDRCLHRHPKRVYFEKNPDGASWTAPAHRRYGALPRKSSFGLYDRTSADSRWRNGHVTINQTRLNIA